MKQFEVLNELGIDNYTPPGFRVWTRGDGYKYRDWGNIPHCSIPTDKMNYIGKVSGEFRSSDNYPAYEYKGLVFIIKEDWNFTSYGSKSRLKNDAVWRLTNNAKEAIL